MNRVAKQYVLPYLWITLASAVYAVGFNWCYEPNQIGFGGITGVGQIINHILPWAPIGTVVIILNIPLFLLGWKLLGGHLLVSSLYSMFISSIFIDILHMLHTFEPMEPILGCIFGGVIMGGSLGVVFLQGATTGGTDLIARLLKLKLAWLPMGRLLLAVDLLVIVAVAVAFRNIYSALYGVVALYISSFVMDQVLYGMDNAKVAYIISDCHEELTRRLLELDRGVTLLQGKGAYSGKDKQVILCACARTQIIPVKRAVQEIERELAERKAYFEILGEGFGVYAPGGL